MRKFLFLFLTMLCMLVSQGLNAQTLTITPRDGGYVDPNGDGVSTIIFGCEDGISINKDFSENQYGSEWTFTIQKDGVDYAIADAYLDENEGIPPTYDGDGNIIAYTFGIIPLENSYDYIELTEEGKYTISIPEGLFTLGSGDDATASSAINYEFTIGTAPAFGLTFTPGKLSTFGTAITMSSSVSGTKVGNIADATEIENVTLTTTDGTTDATVATAAINNTNLLLSFSEALIPGTYTVTIPAGLDNEYEDMQSAESTVEFTVDDEGLGEPIYSTDFNTGWTEIDRKTANGAKTTQTIGDKEITFTFSGAGVYPNKNDQAKFSNYTGYIETAKKSENDNITDENPSSVETTAISSVGKIKFTEAATGSKRGITISVKGTQANGTVDSDWVSLFSDAVNPAAGETEVLEVNRTDCQIKIGSVAADQNGYLLELAIYDIEKDEEPATFEITLDPNGEDNVQSISDITVTPAEGYTISSVTTNEDLAITLTATIDDDEVSYTGTATVDETEGTATITFAADEEGNPITTDGTYTLTIPEGYFVTEDGATSEEATATYTVKATTGDEEPGPEVAYPTTATWDWQNDKPEGINADTNIQGTTGTVASDVEGIELYVDATCEKGKLSTNGGTASGYDYVQMNAGTIVQIPVTSTSDVITVTSYSGQYAYTIGGVAATSDTEVYTPTEDNVTAGYVEMVATSTAYLYSIVAELQGPDDEEGGGDGDSSAYLYSEVEDNTYAITKDASWFAENGFDDWTNDQYSGTIDAGTVVYDGDDIKIETATDTYAGNFGNKCSDMQKDFPSYTGYTVSGSKLDVNFTDEVRIYDPSSIAANNQGVLMVTPYVDGELEFGVYAGDNKRTIGIYELATEEEIAEGTERAWVAINTFKHGGADDTDSTDPTVEKGAPGYVSGSVTAGRQYLLVGGSNKNLTLHQITFTPATYLLDKVDDNVYAITKDSEWYAENGYSGEEGSYSKLYKDAGEVFLKSKNITIETAGETWVATSGEQISQIQAMYPDYTAYINFGSTLDEINENTKIENPTSILEGKWQGMLKVTPTVPGALTFNVHAGSNTRTFGVYDVETDTWITIDNQVTGDVAVSADLEANKEYLLVAQGTNSCLYQIAYTAAKVVGPGTDLPDDAIFATDFTDWTDLSWEDSNGVVVNAVTTTDEYFTFTLWGVQVNTGDVSQWNTDDDGNKTTPKFEGEGALIFAKYAADGSSQYSECEPYVLTSTISYVSKLTFTEAVTGNTRGVKISVMGDGDEDWVLVYDTSINSGATEVEVDIDRTNCQIKIESIALTQNTYILDLVIYGEETVTEPESEPVSGAITWVLDEGTADQPATYSLGTEDAYLSNSITLGSNLVYTGSTRTVTDGNENNETYGETVTFTTFNNLADEAETEAAESNAIDFAVEMAEGYTFAPTEVSLYATRIGTDACNLNVTWVDSEGNETLMIATSSDTGNNPGRANGTPNTFTKYTLDLSEYGIETIEDGTFTLRINVFNMAGGKTFGLANIVIKGQVSGVDIDDIYETLCDEIDATDDYLESTWETIETDYADAITDELKAEYESISKEIVTLQAAVDGSYEEGSLGEEVLDYEAQIEAIKAEIDALLETASGINSITIESAGAKGIYTISGQKVAAPTKAGIYIIDGKKVVIK